MPGNPSFLLSYLAKQMDTRVKPAHDGLARVNPSLTLLAKFVSVAIAASWLAW
jgi:hypothetical protein